MHSSLLSLRFLFFISAHWESYRDNETGILVYTWSVGDFPCEEGVHPHRDPHEHLSDASEWTHEGSAYPLNLAGKKKRS